MKAYSIRLEIVLAAFVIFIGSLACSAPQTPTNTSNSQATVNSGATTATAQCPSAEELNDKILDRLKNVHSAKYPFLNTKTTWQAIYLHGYTTSEAEFLQVESTIRAVLQENRCPNMQIDECHFRRTPPDPGHYLRQNSGGGCTPPYTECGSICLPPPETCDGDRDRISLSPTPKPSPSPTRSN